MFFPQQGLYIQRMWQRELMIKQLNISRKENRVKIILEEIELNKDFQEIISYMRNKRQNVGMESC